LRQGQLIQGLDPRADLHCCAVAHSASLLRRQAPKLHRRAIARFASLLRRRALKLHPLSFISLPQPHHCAFARSSSSLMRLRALILMVAPSRAHLLLRRRAFIFIALSIFIVAPFARSFHRRARRTFIFIIAPSR
jgi:hypothetical protein